MRGRRLRRQQAHREHLAVVGRGAVREFAAKEEADGVHRDSSSHFVRCLQKVKVGLVLVLMVAATPGTEMAPPTDNAGCDILSFTFACLRS